MIFSAILSFLGGAAARAAIGYLFQWLEKKQAHSQEMEHLRLQGELDQAAHVRQLAQIQLQSDLKLGEIKLVGEAAVNELEAQGWVEAMKESRRPTGVKWVDAWNGTIRPAAATISIALWMLKVVKAGLVLTAWDEQLVSSVLGYFFADRQLGKRK